MKKLTYEELKEAARRHPGAAMYINRKRREVERRQAMANESEVKYTSPPTPGELLDAALLELDAVTDENFREQVQKARELVAQANKWVGSHLMFAGETKEDSGS